MKIHEITTIAKNDLAMSDSGQRRILSLGRDFDTRAVFLTQEIREEWSEDLKNSHLRSKEGIIEGLRREFGEQKFEEKLKNFIDIDTKPFSIVSYHNLFFHQVRNSFVIGSYYPALVAACALGERILNHLILDLRDQFKGTTEYKKVYRKSSFDDWGLPISTLLSWKVLLPELESDFRDLMSLRHRSIHFNPKTYQTVREDALAAILHLRKIIELQFGAIGRQPWFIEGTKGHFFIKKDYENSPFVRCYFGANGPYVGYLFRMTMGDDGRWRFFDFDDYGESALTDEEFAAAFNNRIPEHTAEPLMSP